MATSTYTITLVDNASRSANQVALALQHVAAASNRTATAMLFGSKAEQSLARNAEKLAGAELRAARAMNAVDRAALKNSKALGLLQKKAAPDRLKSFGTAAQAVAGYLGTQLVGATLSAARGFLEAAGQVAQFESALSNLGKGDATLSANWEKELVRLRVPLEQGRRDVIGLLAAFKGVKDVNAGIATNDILKLGSALALSAEQSKSFNKIFKDIGGKGKIQREELVGQLGDIGIGVTSTDFLQEVSRMTGKTFAQAEKMLSEGKITSDIAIPALIQATKTARGITDLDSAADKAAQGATGALTALDNAVLKFRETIGKGMVEGGAAEKIGRLADGILKFTQAHPDAITRLAVAFGTLTAVLGTIGAVAGYLAVLSVALKFLTATLIPAVSAVWAFIAPWLIAAAPFIAAGAALYFLGQQVVGLWRDLGGWAVIWPAIQGFFRDLGAAAGNLGAQALTWGQNIVQGLINGITGGIGRAVEAVSNLGASVINAGASVLGIQSPSKVFAEQGKYIDEGLALGIEDHSDLALASAESLADGVISEAEMAAATGGGVNQTAAANVGAAAGAAMAATTENKGGASIGAVNVSISVDGAKDANTTVQTIRAFFDTEFASLLERQLEAQGA